MENKIHEIYTSFVIAYKALQDEPNWSAFPGFNEVKPLFVVEQNPNISPIETSLKLLKSVSYKNVSILVPGRKFDIFGTRHGRGGGWYDKFLSNLPKHWKRIGVTYDHDLSSVVLTRNSWDEKMDLLLICDSKTNSWKCVECKL